jgi:UDP-N-acetylglucosamine 2-epimerase (non-hydrolysing)
MKILTVIGTRPEAIKLAPVIEGLGKHSEAESLVCVTGQHKELLDQAVELFGIKADYDLNVMVADQSLAELTVNLLPKLNSLVHDIKPDWVLAEGDTTSCLTTALTCYYNQVPFAHVEAGPRSHVKFNGFPEEMNRVLADHLSDLLFAPTKGNVRNLYMEGLWSNVVLTGNTGVDSLLAVKDLPFNWASSPLATIPDRKLIVITTHHRSVTWGSEQAMLAVKELAYRFKDYQFVWPVHPNPNISGSITNCLNEVSNVTLTVPLDYLAMVNLMKKAELILTDSGGIITEAPTLHVPVLQLLDVTALPESIESGQSKLIGTGKDKIVTEVGFLLNSPVILASMRLGKNPYGDGKAASRIVKRLLEVTC